ncbi:SinR repressor/SinI anti-repressor dimerization [Penicillium samsonianum]|uniref:SinR repressor/SinI anti-repressor dimerization n=1 Tax=Penicillium samsonianum TaxID=1882272 RepID=UPI002547207D|nr:SinR repressor/SinI anti-repressor dimerization [Penicillium samsonianum]KAJ6118768.1 SinR repressor/SinI anti-repressor dimerization [Penicillium samsonianum]
MNKMGTTQAKEVMKVDAGKTAPLNGKGFYAVANGVNPGIYDLYRGRCGAEKEVQKEPGSCHKKFRTRAQAEAFIEDWKESHADVWRELIKEVLDQGLRPRDPIVWKTGGMKSIIEQFMYEPGKSTEVDEITEKAKQLSLQQPKQNN